MVVTWFRWKKLQTLKTEGFLDDDVFAPIGMFVVEKFWQVFVLVVWVVFSEEMSGNKVPEGYEL